MFYRSLLIFGHNMKFSEGEEVLVKHPSTDRYHKGKILSMRGERYKVQFETGIEQYVHSTDIKVPVLLNLSYFIYFAFYIFYLVFSFTTFFLSV